MMEEKKNLNPENAGSLKITEEVVAIIAGVAATEVPGVAGMSGGIAGGIAEMLGRKNLSKGVKVEVGEKQAAIDLFIVVDYGCRIPEISWEIQEKVKNAVENMTGLNAIEVNIHVQGVNFEKKSNKEQSNTEKKEQKSVVKKQPTKTQKKESSVRSRKKQSE